MGLVTNNLLTQTEVSKGRSQTETLPYCPRDSEVNTAALRFEIFPVKTEPSRLISCLIYGFLLWFCRPITDLWQLLENNALELANQGAYYVSYKHKPYNNNSYVMHVLCQEIIPTAYFTSFGAYNFLEHFIKEIANLHHVHC